MAKVEVLIETTKWDVEYKQPNHTYLVRDNKLLGTSINGVVKYYKKPLMFDRRGRTFKKGDMSLFREYK